MATLADCAKTIFLKKTITGFFYDEDRQFFDIIVEETFSEGDTVVASMEFQGNLRDDLAGLYRSSYVEDGVTKYLAVTQFQSTDARFGWN